MQEQEEQPSVDGARFQLAPVAIVIAVAHFYLLHTIQKPIRHQGLDNPDTDFTWLYVLGAISAFFAIIGLGSLRRSNLIPVQIFDRVLYACACVCWIFWVIAPLVGFTDIYDDRYDALKDGHLSLSVFFRAFYPGVTRTLLASVYLVFPLLAVIYWRRQNKRVRKVTKVIFVSSEITFHSVFIGFFSMNLMEKWPTVARILAFWFGSSWESRDYVPLGGIGAAINSLILSLLLWAGWGFMNARYPLHRSRLFRVFRTIFILVEIVLHSIPFGFLFFILNVPNFWFSYSYEGLFDFFAAIISGAINFCILAISTWAVLELFRYRKHRSNAHVDHVS